VLDFGVGITHRNLVILKQILKCDDCSVGSIESYINNHNKISTGLGLKIASKIVEGLINNAEQENHF